MPIRTFCDETTLTLQSPVFICPLFAQGTPVAPSAGETAGPARGVDYGDYNVIQQWETGYRYALIGGDVGRVPGVDMSTTATVSGCSSSSLSVNSRDGHGKYFDEIVLTNAGSGRRPI